MPKTHGDITKHLMTLSPSVSCLLLSSIWMLYHKLGYVDDTHCSFTLSVWFSHDDWIYDIEWISLRCGWICLVWMINSYSLMSLINFLTTIGASYISISGGQRKMARHVLKNLDGEKQEYAEYCRKHIVCVWTVELSVSQSQRNLEGES